jgi:hypothetical protein
MRTALIGTYCTVCNRDMLQVEWPSGMLLAHSSPKTGDPCPGRGNYPALREGCDGVTRWGASPSGSSEQRVQGGA